MNQLRTPRFIAANDTSLPRGLLAVRADGSGTQPPASPAPASVPAQPRPGGDPVALLTQLHEAWNAYREMNDRQVAELRQGVTAAASTDALETLSQRIGDIQAELERQAALTAAARIGGNGGEPRARRQLTPEVRAYNDVFANWFRGRTDDNALRTAGVQAAMHRESDTDGGFLVPEEVEQDILRVLGAQSVMRQIATVRQIGSPTYRRPVQTQGAAGGWVGEREARPETAAPKLTEMVIETHELYANPAATQLLLDDAFLDIGEWLSGEVNITFNELENEAFITGDGVRKPRGILSYATVATGWTWGNILHVVSGNASTISNADSLIDLMTSLKPGYMANASWLMNRATQATLRKFKDTTNQYIWQPGLQAGAPATLFGYPVRNDDEMPNIGANAYPIAFGDFRRGYLILDRFGTRVLRDPYTNKPYVHFYTTRRVGGAVQDFDAFRVLKVST